MAYLLACGYIFEVWRESNVLSSSVMSSLLRFAIAFAHSLRASGVATRTSLAVELSVIHLAVCVLG